VEFIFSYGMPWGNDRWKKNVNLSDQQSVRCEVTVLFNKKSEQLCQEFIGEGVSGSINSLLLNTVNIKLLKIALFRKTNYLYNCRIHLWVVLAFLELALMRVHPLGISHKLMNKTI
jgi:hypothetical protein